MVSYKDIQRETGLSLATISKYFNGRNVLDENRVAIEQAATALNFQPNGFARSLRSQRSRTVGVLLPVLNNEFHLTVIAGVEEALRGQGMSVIVASSPHSEDRAVGLLLSRMVDGIIAVPSPHDVDALQKASERIPVVALDWELPNLNVDGVFLDNIRAGQLAARHIVDHGHQRIALISGDPTVSTMRLRAEGFVQELSRLGAPTPPLFAPQGPLTIEHGYESMVHLLDAEPRPTAVFCTNYPLMVGSIIALNESGLRLGRDMSMVGFDGLEVARTTVPRLTIIDQPMRKIATEAAELVTDRLAHEYNPHAPKVRRLFAPKLRIGASVSRLD